MLLGALGYYSHNCGIMKSTIGGLFLCLGASLVGSASMAGAFSMGGSLHQNLPMVRSVGDPHHARPLSRQHTKIFMTSDASARVISDDVQLVVEDRKADNAIEFLSQEGQMKMGLNSAAR